MICQVLTLIWIKSLKKLPDLVQQLSILKIIMISKHSDLQPYWFSVDWDLIRVFQPVQLYSLSS